MMMIDSLPVLAICGFSGSGKTTLILKLLQYLCGERGLSVAVLKNDVHGLNIDTPGKDTDRFFEAGANVQARGPRQEFHRGHPRPGQDILYRLRVLAGQHDFILLEGHKKTDLPKVWLLSDGEQAPPEGIKQVLVVLPRDTDRFEQVLPLLKAQLQVTYDHAPVYGCVLIGGKSQRMGTPKHLLMHEQKTWLEHTIDQMMAVCHDVVICGRGDMPEALAHHTRLPDPPDVKGPMAGITACLRWLPNTPWLVAACDLPKLTRPALQWLLDQRAPGIWGVIPKISGSPGLEPLLAYYDGRCQPLCEALVAQRNYCPVAMADHARVINPEIPAALAGAWENANTPQALAQGPEHEIPGQG
jgi:molybdopterin-guanine dinucleotide biosynthesis protein A